MKLFFTVSNSHHNVQILKSFIFMHYGMQQILLNFVFQYCRTKSTFFCIHGHCTCKNDLSQYHEKF